MVEKRPYRLEITLSDAQVAKLDRARGHEPRASFVKRTVEAWCDGLLSPQVVSPGGTLPSPEQSEQIRRLEAEGKLNRSAHRLLSPSLQRFLDKSE